MEGLSPVSAGRSITEQVYAAMRSRLLAGAHAPGARLSEAGLAQRLDVSRGPVREALERLVQEGLLVRRPRRGTFVRRYGIAEVRGLLEVRQLLEAAAARLAAQRATAEDLEWLRALLDEAENALDRSEACPPHDRFHHLLAALSKNPELARLVAMVYDQIRLARALTGRRDGRACQAWREHAAVLRAVLAGDAAAAEAAMRAHLAAAEAAMLALVDDTDAVEEGPKRRSASALPIGRSR